MLIFYAELNASTGITSWLQPAWYLCRHPVLYYYYYCITGSITASTSIISHLQPACYQADAQRLTVLTASIDINPHLQPSWNYANIQRDTN